MTEIEKMYENANIKPKQEGYCDWDSDCPYPDIINSGCGNECPYWKYKDEANYPSFTAEKQLKIIQLLSKIRDDIQLCYFDNQYIFVVNFETAKCQWANKYHDKLDKALADMVNVLWQDLTDQEKEEIRKILNENS